MIDTVALKRRVLELAMTGKLSKYQLGDDKIGDVLDRIIKEKEDLLIKRNGRKDNNIKNRDECENDELPENWTWIRFGYVFAWTLMLILVAVIYFYFKRKKWY